ncbi:hypothetical protein [Pengzhenrongella frigida]|uniref:Uncharacterized protein n=1 Tax=Pengzhenrongella frigida TaxID=1259133 RepID=A0A4Q5MVN2_9MICO|nr:hypothetical protein [Cellulomonas sp. HLT2-17]RYV49672.1 hypothetical protein EUA98_17490 [Cellulomonas sp. HLT2-17]
MPVRPPAELARYLVEWYRAGLTDDVLDQTADRVLDSARQLADEGEVAVLLLTLFVPEDEVAFSLFAARSPLSVARVYQRADLPYHRIVQAMERTEVLT